MFVWNRKDKHNIPLHAFGTIRVLPVGIGRLFHVGVFQTIPREGTQQKPLSQRLVSLNCPDPDRV